MTTDNPVVPIGDPSGPADDPAAPTLDDAQLAVLAGFGQRRAVAVGDVLYAEGDATYDFFVMLSGVVEGAARSIRVIGSRHLPEALAMVEFLTRNRLPHQWLDAETEPDIERL